MTLSASEFRARMKAASDTAGIDGLLGQSITYTPVGGSGSAINAVVSEEPEARNYAEDGVSINRVVKALIALDDVSDPDVGDKFTYDSTTFAVTEVQRNPITSKALLMGVAKPIAETRQQSARIRRS